VKYFTLRPQSIDKISQRKNSPSINLPVKGLERVNKITAEKPVNQRIPVREPKVLFYLLLL